MLLKSPADIFVVLPVHNRVLCTTRIVRELHRQYQKLKFILVDDGSVDGTSTAVKSIVPDVFIIRGNGNLWWGGSLQAAYKHLKKVASVQDIVIIMNDDISIPPNFIETIQSWFHNHTSGIHFPDIFDANTKQREGFTKISWLPLEFFPATLHNSECISTRCIALTWAVHQQIGGFRPFLLPHYLSDYEFTYRAHRKNIPFFFHNELVIFSDSNSSGMHHIISKKRSHQFYQLFSKKYSANPIYRFVFILLCCPRKILVKSFSIELIRFCYTLFTILTKPASRLQQTTNQV